jgi:hypothetical protein
MGMQAVTALTVSAAFVFGLVLALLGSLKLALAGRVDLREGRIGWLLAGLNLVLIPLVLVVGLFLDYGGVKAVTITGSVLLTLALLSLSASPTYYRALAAVLVAGFGAACLGTASVVLMPRAFFGAREMSESLNLGMVFVAVGALVAPALLDLLTRLMGPRKGMALLALVCLAPAFLAAFPNKELLETAYQRGTLDALFDDAGVWMAGLVFFFYAPLEACISVWAATFLADQQPGQRRAAWLLVGFWSAFLGARVLVSLVEYSGYFGDRWSPWLLVLPALGAAAILGNLSGSDLNKSMWPGVLLLGLVLGPVVPILLSILFRLPGVRGYPGTAYGLVYALGSLGGLLMAPVIGTAAKRGDARTVLRVPMLLGLAMTAVAVLFVLLAGRVA